MKGLIYTILGYVLIWFVAVALAKFVMAITPYFFTPIGTKIMFCIFIGLVFTVGFLSGRVSQQLQSAK